ncbi:MAG: class I SAM-dependent methyltransferase [Bacteroidia bacterium]
MGINLHQIKSYIKHFFTATRKGHNVHSPFVYALCEEVFYNKGTFYDFEKLDKVREGLLKDNTELRIEDFGAGSKSFKSDTRRVCDIAASGISTKKQSETIYKLINFLKSENIVELGTSLGLTTLYLSRANKTAQVYSIEGSKELAAFSTALLQNNEAKNATVINGKFEDELPKVLDKISPLDLFYIDGNHTYEATLNYFEMALSKKANTSVFIFDDIYWSEGMTRAWQEIKKHSSVTLSIDAFYFGFIFFKPEVKEKIDVKILL